jgi:predicted membrane-bound mannosyltransferase
MQTDTIDPNLIETPVQVAPEAPPTEAPSSATDKSATGKLWITGEIAIYVILVAFGLALRLPQLGAAPLDYPESHEALAAFRAIQPSAPGSPLVSTNPLMFGLNTIVMGIYKTDNFSARLATALVGVLVIFLPFLLRRWLGAPRALLMAALLALSPVLLSASYTMSGTVWSAALVLLTIWAVGQFVETRRIEFGMVGTVSGAMLLFTAESTGFITFLALLIGLIYALMSGGEGPVEENIENNAEPRSARLRESFFDTLRSWPWIPGLVIALAAIAVVTTTFFIHPTGFSNIGEALNRGLSGLVTRPEGAPVAYPLWVSLLYEPVLWIFGIAGAFLVITEGGNFLARVFLGWFAVALVAGILYAGGLPMHALWFTLPLAGLAAIAVERVLTPVRERFVEVPGWAPWLHGVGMIVMLSALGIYILTLARALLRADDSDGFLPHFPQDIQHSQWIMILLVLLLMGMTFLLVGSTWSNRTAWRGTGIGLLIFLLFAGFGMGWRSALQQSDDARDPWHPHAVSTSMLLLRDTLQVMSLRQTGDAHDIQITVAVSDDSPVAWTLHDYNAVTYVPQISNALDTPLIIAPLTQDKNPKFGAVYIGQTFTVSSTFDRNRLSWWDYIPWLTLRETRIDPTADQQIVLWARSDVYSVTSSDTQPALPSNPPVKPNN